MALRSASECNDTHVEISGFEAIVVPSLVFSWVILEKLKVQSRNFGEGKFILERKDVSPIGRSIIPSSGLVDPLYA